MSWRRLVGRVVAVVAAPVLMAGAALPAAAGSPSGHGAPTSLSRGDTQMASFYLYKTVDTVYTEVYVEAGNHWYVEGGTDLGPYVSVSEYAMDITTPEEPTMLFERHGMLTGAHVTFGRQLSSASFSETVDMYDTDAEVGVPTLVSGTWSAIGAAMRSREHYTQGIPGLWTSTTSGQGSSREATATVAIGDQHFQSESPDTDSASISSWRWVTHTVGDAPTE